MGLHLKKVEDQVIVLTGASSGIGLATAREAAARGARLVLAARNEDALRQLTDEIRTEGGEAIYVVADVGNEADVRGIAHVALQRFGGFDTWINNAGVGMYGSILDGATEDFRRLFDTNFWGVVYGSITAARILRERKRDAAGAIINIGSEVGDRAVPLIGVYSASKHAVKGFTDALRMELEKAGDPIVVTLVKPGATDTPFPHHARNTMEEEPELPSPIYSPEVVARTILHCAETPERDVFVGYAAKRNSIMGYFVPRIADWLMEAMYFDKQKSGKPATHAEESLEHPTTGLRERGGSPHHVRRSSVYTQASLHPIATAALLACAGVAIGALLQGSKK